MQSIFMDYWQEFRDYRKEFRDFRRNVKIEFKRLRRDIIEIKMSNTVFPLTISP